MIRRILVPLDGSSRAEQVLPHLVALARVFESRLDLLHVIPGGGLRCGGSPVDPFGARMARADRTRYLEVKAGELRSTGLEVWTRVEEGGPAAVIVDLLRRGEYDLVGLTPHGGGDDRLLRIGCTALAVIMNAQVGIFLAPDIPQPRQDRMTRRGYSCILAPVDCSPRSDWSLGLAAALAVGSDARLEVVHVLDFPDVVSRLPGSGRARELADRLRDENRCEAKRYLDEVAWRFDGSEVRVECRIVDGGSGSADALLDIARSEEADLIIMSAHGGGASTAWPIGGTAAKVLLLAGRPVLVLQDLPMERFQPQRVSQTVRALAADR